MLCKAWWAFASEAPNSVDTEELTVMLFGGTFIQIFACLPIWLKAVSSGAGAHITSFSVLTYEVTRLRRQCTLIHIDTRGGREVCFVAYVTVTSEGPNCVDTLTIFTQVWNH